MIEISILPSRNPRDDDEDAPRSTISARNHRAIHPGEERDGFAGGIALKIVRDAFRGRRGRKAPDGTSEGTVSRFASGRLPNGDAPRSGRSAS